MQKGALTSVSLSLSAKNKHSSDRPQTMHEGRGIILVAPQREKYLSHGRAKESLPLSVSILARFELFSLCVPFPLGSERRKLKAEEEMAAGIRNGIPRRSEGEIFKSATDQTALLSVGREKGTFDP